MDGGPSVHIGPETDDARDGSEKAFEAIYARHSERLWPYACAMSDDFDDAQDLMQETFVRAYQRLHTLRSPQALASWLATLMSRLAAGRLFVLPKKRFGCTFRESARMRGARA